MLDVDMIALQERLPHLLEKMAGSGEKCQVHDELCPLCVEPQDDTDIMFDLSNKYFCLLCEVNVLVFVHRSCFLCGIKYEEAFLGHQQVLKPLLPYVLYLLEFFRDNPSPKRS
jgi:hypothetical protein